MPEDQVMIKKESHESDGMVCCSDGKHYPYGTSLRFEDEMIEELGAGNLVVGDLVEVRGYALVENKSMHENTDGAEKSISLQLTSIKLQRETSDRVEQLYGPKT